MKVRDKSILPPHKLVSINICVTRPPYYPMSAWDPCQFGIQRSMWCLDGQSGAMPAWRSSATVLQISGGTLATSLGTFRMWSLQRECPHSLLDLTFACPSLHCQLSVNHSSQYWFHSLSQPLNSSWNIFFGGQIDRLPFSPFPECCRDA